MGVAILICASGANLRTLVQHETILGVARAIEVKWSFRKNLRTEGHASIRNFHFRFFAWPTRNRQPSSHASKN